MTHYWRLATVTVALVLGACSEQGGTEAATEGATELTTAEDTFAVALIPASVQAPDRVLLGGQVITVDANDSIAEAVAITGNRITAVGSTDDIRAMVGASTEVIELEGKTVIPGLTDGHIHVIRAGLTWAQEINWAGVPSLDAALAIVRSVAAETPEGEWLIVAGGWHIQQFTEQRLPTAAEVAEAAGNHPIYVQYLYDTAILNSMAMAELNISDDADLPANGGVLRRDADGNPTGEIDGGLLVFHGLLGALPKPDVATQIAGTKEFMSELNRLGMTSFSDGSGGSHYPQAYQPLFQIWQSGELTMRVTYRLMSQKRGEELADLQNLTQLLPQGFGDDWLKFTGFGEVIIWGMHDGSRARLEFNPPDEAKAALRETLGWMAENRYAMEIHAASDVSAQQILDIMDEVNSVTSIADLRWSILHIDAASVNTLERMKALGVAYAVQNRLYYDGEALVNTFGEEYASSAPRLKTAFDMGLMVSGGTDAPAVGPYNPWVSLRWMLNGKTVSGAAIRSEAEFPTRLQTLRTYTMNAAWLQFADEQRGSIEVGKLADIAVISGDYLSMPVDSIAGLTSLLTIVDGQVVYADAPYNDIVSDVAQ